MLYPIPIRLRFPVFVISLLLTAVVAWLMAAPLTTEHAPFGIVSLELARYPEVAQRVIGSWSADQQAQAAAGVGWDFVWLLCYSTSLSLACVWAAEKLGRFDFALKIGYFLAWLCWLAALLDGVENIALLRMLGGDTGPPWPALSYWAALVKFDIVILGFLYVLAGAAMWLVLGLSRRSGNVRRET
ncbi:MAG: hypothetical protein KJZ86_14695 [Caldilineaceae bacterium]|nr:hypothetical protein [Caldilineaceae bacterium]HRJ44190.1 hypothetical protein [Caldilineaceae bacterium]